MAITGNGNNNFCFNVSGDSLAGIHYLLGVRVVFSAGAAGNSALLVDAQNSTIYHCIADGANYTDGWAVLDQVNGIELSALTGDAEVYVKVRK